MVSFTRDRGMGLAVRSGGHSVAGHSTPDGAILLDLSLMKELEVDAEAGSAWAQTGLTALEYTAGVGERGLVTRPGRHRKRGDRRHHAGRRHRVPRPAVRAHRR